MKPYFAVGLFLSIENATRKGSIFFVTNVNSIALYGCVFVEIRKIDFIF